MRAPAHSRPRRRWALAPLSLALLAPAAHGAAFAPGTEADPPTGELPAAHATPDEPLRGSGIQWTLAPWRRGGTLAVDLRSLRLEDGRRTRQSLLVGDIDMVSYVWQPWFVQLRLGAGFVVSQSSGEAQLQGQQAGSLTGRAAIAVFPASRFPFELRADLSDSRTGDPTLAGDYRSRRVAVSQGWRPATGNDSLQLQVDHSQLDDGVRRDTLTTVTATGLRQSGQHTMDLGLNWSGNRVSGEGGETRLAALSARHSFRPSSELSLETVANWNDVRFGSAGSGTDLGSDVRQVSSLASWRPRTGLWSGAAAPLVAATARWVEARSLGVADANRVQAWNLSVGASQELSPAWRASVSAAASHVDAERAPGRAGSALQGALVWSPSPLLLAGWRYAPSAGFNGGFVHEAQFGVRKTAGLQASHAVSRDWSTAEAAGLSLSLTQSAAVLRESGVTEPSQALAHGASATWQRLADDGGQAYAGLSVSDARSLGDRRGSFQLVNLQWNQRLPLSRHANVAVALTAQTTRNRSSEVDVFTGERRDLASGWLPFYSGTLSYEHQRAFGVPRLRHTVLAGANSQPLERRALGDIDAPRERITQSLESRLDYAIGRLDMRLSLRAARIEDRTVVALQARAQRRF